MVLGGSKLGDKITIMLFDGGYKDSAPALLCLAHQTILSDLQILWVEYYDAILSKVYEFDFITRVKLGIDRKALFNTAYCHNTGIKLAKSKYFVILDPCLWFSPDLFERIYNFREANQDVTFTYQREIRSNDQKNRFFLTDNYFSKIEDFYKRQWNDQVIGKNFGCVSTFKTDQCRTVNGFDIFYTSDDKLVDRASVSLCLDRLKNKFGGRVIPLDPAVLHSWHPMEDAPVNAAFMNGVEANYRAKGVTQAEKGLSYMEERFDLVLNDGEYSLRRR
jgi:hypothetical protein